MSEEYAQFSTGDERSGAAGAADGGNDTEPSYFCTAPAGVQGTYDGLETWSLHAGATRNPRQQVEASLHERLHHELQHTSPWGLLARFALDLSRQGIHRERYHRLFRFCRDSARTVHEVYATALSVGGVATADGPTSTEEHLSEDYVAYLQKGRALAGSLPWETGRFCADALLRCCMSPARMLDLGGLAALRIVDLDQSLTRPDRRLARINASVVARIPSPELYGLRDSSTPTELDRYYSAVAASLTEASIPTMDAAAVRRYVRRLIDDVVAQAPTMRARITIDDMRDAATDDLQEHSRERLYLHTAPLPVEVVNEADLPQHVAHFARHHPSLGTHVLVVWMPFAQLAKQFTGMLAGSPSWNEDVPRLPLLSAGKDARGVPCAWLSAIADLDPGTFVRAMTTNTVTLTTASALMLSPVETDFEGIDPLIVLVDGPVLPRILERYAGRVGLMWHVYEVRGDRYLYAVVIRMTVLSNYAWMTITGVAGRSYLQAWLEALGEDTARRLASAFAEFDGQLTAAIQHVVETWWYLAQERESVFDAIGE